MRKIKEVLRLKWEQGCSNREIATACHVSCATVHEYVRRATSAGLAWPLPQELSDDVLETRLFPPPQPASVARAQPDFEHITRHMRRKGVTLFLLWEEYRALHPDGYGYSRFCELCAEHTGRLDPRLRQVHRAGEKLFVDYAGQTVTVLDRNTGQTRQAQVFVATLGASDYTFAEATWTQGLEDWIGSHVRAFTFFGGVPEIVVPDNLKAGVTQACYYEPAINPSYNEMARHYGVAVLPARVAKPRDKAKVENHVLQVERRILAPLRDRIFLSLEECNQAMAALLTELNARPFQQLNGCRRQLFEEVEAPALRPLPVAAYCFAHWRKARVGIDYHIAVEHCFYSVPYTLIRQEVEVRLTHNTVEVFHHGQRIASHPRCTQRNRHVTTTEHMPKAHQAYLEWTPQRLVQWARTAGTATAQVVEAIMSSRSHPQQGFRSCLGIMRLGKEFGQERLEAACVRALAIGSPRYKSVHSILQHKLDQDTPALQVSRPNPEPPDLNHANIRGAAYYQAAPAARTAFTKEYSC